MTVSRYVSYALVVVIAAGGLWHFFQECVAYSQGTLLDLPLFGDAAIRYWQGLPVYVRTDDLLAQYKPGAIVYKFPPPYLLIWLPWFDASGQWPPLFQPIFMAASAALYLSTVLMVLAQTAQAAAVRPLWPLSPNAALFSAVTVALACWLVPILYVLGATSAENLMVCLALLAFCVAQRWPWLAGCLLAYLAMMKLYPVFLLLYPLLTRQWRVLAAALVSLVGWAGVSVAVFGWEENRFYVTHILPILLQEPVSNDWTHLLHPAVGNLSLVPVMVGHSWVFPSRDTIWLNLVRLPMLAVLCALLPLYLQRQRPWGPLLGFSLTIVTMLASLPNLFYPYFTWLVVPLVVLAAVGLQQRSGVLLLLVLVCVMALLVNDVWILECYRAAGLEQPTPELVTRVEAEGPWSVLWQQSPLLAVLITAGQLVPFTPYLLWAALLYGLWRGR